jgi:hypothetical protein
MKILRWLDEEEGQTPWPEGPLCTTMPTRLFLHTMERELAQNTTTRNL